MKLVIFGASGATGKHLVQQALEQGYEVTAFVRDPNKLSLQHERLSIAQGNVSNYGAVEKAIQGKDAVLSTLGANSPFRYDAVVTEGLSHIVRAMEQLRLQRLIYLSFIGVKESRRAAGTLIRWVAPTLLRTEVAGHEAREKLIRQSLVNWTIVRPPTLSNGALVRRYRSGETICSTSFVTALSRADVAHFMLTQLADKSYTRKAVRLLP
jgi:putative NADH-flavin reductase